MSDDLDDLKSLAAALKAAPPAPDAAAKARALALAIENFDRLHQGTAQDARSTDTRPSRAGFLNGVRSMLGYLTSRPALAASTSVAALVIGVAVILPVTQNRLPPVAPKVEAPAAPEVSTSTAEAAGVAPAADAPVEMTAAPEEPLAPATDLALPEGGNATAAAPVLEGELKDLGGLAEADEGRARKEAPADGTLAYLPETAAAPAPVTAPDPMPQLTENTEAYASAPANPVKVTAEEPVSTFSTDVDTASMRSSVRP